jgi:hypothetical protein
LADSAGGIVNGVGVARNEERVMVRTAGLLLLLALWAGTPLAPEGRAQTTDGPTAPAGPPQDRGSAAPPAAESAWQPEFLRTLPRPPAQPASLLAPPPLLGPPPPDLERPYFQQDPLLDPPWMPPVGWFADLDVGILKPHLQNQLINTADHPLTFPNGTTVTVGLPAAQLDWTVSPRFALGYRLPSGFGEIYLAYRFMTSQGTDPVVSADGPAVLKSRLDVNLADLDWASQEFTPWKYVDLKFHFGLRYFYLYFDSQAYEPFAAAAAGTGILNARTTNSFVGFGPHAGVDLRRRLGVGGLSLVGRLDFSTAFGRIRQGFFASSTTLGPDGQPQTAVLYQAGSQSVPTLNARLGLDWYPPDYRNVRLFAGYQFEYWWNAGRYNPSATPPGSFGEFFDQGAVLKAEINF